MQETTYDVLVRGMWWESDNVMSLTLTHPHGQQLPAWQPGAHLDLVLPSGLVRQYSLCSDPANRMEYRLAVLLEPDGRGGSEEVHTTVRPGMTLSVRGPRNHFKLEEGAPHHLLIAGGIGITPILTMAHHLTATGRSTKVIYGGASRTTMAFADELESMLGPSLALHPKDETGRADLLTELQQAPTGTAVYVCGPEGLIQDVERMTGELLGEDAFHAERFAAAAPSPGDIPDEANDEFEVELKQSGCTVQVPRDRSILDVVLEVNPTVLSSCEEGFCGTCETRVLEGTPDHRDTILSQKERANNDTMFICVSRSKCPKLVLDA